MVREASMDMSGEDEAGIVRDPVCGMTVDPAAGKPSHRHGGRTFHFCSEGCREKFAADPEAYLDREGPGLRDDGGPGERQARAAARGGAALLLLGALPRAVRGGAGALRGRDGRRGDAAGAAGDDLHLPDASRDRAGRPGKLPDLRHGARAQGRAGRRRGTEPRARRLPPPLRGRRRADRAARPRRDGPDARAARRRLDRGADGALARAGARDAGGAVVRVALPRPRLDLVPDAGASTCSA